MSVKVLDRTQAQMKAAITEVGQRTLDFYAAAFSTTPDKNGDLIDPHALDAWLKSFYKIGKPLPISFAHGAIRTDTDPFAIIGYAPADSQHVWIDDYGLRVKALLDMENPTARQVASLIDNGVLGGASIAYMAEREKRLPDGSARITQMSVIEAGPCLEPANAEAVVLGLKTMLGLSDAASEESTVAPEAKTEASEAVVTVGAPNVTVTYGTLEAHQASVSASKSEEHQTVELTSDERRAVIEALASAAEMKHGTAPTHIQHAHDALVRAGAKCAASEAVTKNDSDDVQAWLRRMRHIKLSVT